MTRFLWSYFVRGDEERLGHGKPQPVGTWAVLLLEEGSGRRLKPLGEAVAAVWPVLRGWQDLLRKHGDTVRQRPDLREFFAGELKRSVEDAACVLWLAAGNTGDTAPLRVLGMDTTHVVAEFARAALRKAAGRERLWPQSPPDAMREGVLMLLLRLFAIREVVGGMAGEETSVQWREAVVWAGFTKDRWEKYRVGSLPALSWLSGMKGVAAGALVSCARCHGLFIRTKDRARARLCGPCHAIGKDRRYRQKKNSPEDKAMHNLEKALDYRVLRRLMRRAEADARLACAIKDMERVRAGLLPLEQWDSQHRLPLLKRKPRTRYT